MKNSTFCLGVRKEEGGGLSKLFCPVSRRRGTPFVLAFIRLRQ